MHIVVLQSYLAKARRYPLVQRVIINSGLAAVDGVDHPQDLHRLAVIPPYASNWRRFSAAEQDKLISNFLAVYLHNSINTKDFPTDKVLTGLLCQLELTVKSLHHNAWRHLLERYGDTGEAPDKAAFMGLPLEEQVRLSACRNEWEHSVAPILEEMIRWVRDNSGAIQEWHISRLKLFS